MRIIFMGTPPFALPTLSLLLENSYDIPAVVTTPDKPQGRGQKTAPSPVKEFALQRAIKVVQPESLRDPQFHLALSSLKPDLLVVVAFRILPPEVFNLAVHGGMNLHASLLPKFRGAAPINWAIMAGERETGVTTFFLQKAVDTGSIILQARVKIGPDETAGDLHDRLADVGAEIVLQSVRLIESNRVSLRSQDESLASRAPKLFRDGCRIDWNKPSIALHNFVRGLSPAPTAWTTYQGKVLRIYRTVMVEGGEGRPGEVIANGSSLQVQTGAGRVSIVELQQEGRKRMKVDEFLRGYPLNSGDLLE